MRAFRGVWLAWGVAAWFQIAHAAPLDPAQAKYREAAALVDEGNIDQALAVIDDGLAIAPHNSSLLGLKGRALLAVRDYAEALVAYESYLESGVVGANRRQALQIVSSLSAVRATFLDVTITNGPAALYLDSRSLGAFCTPAPTCHKPILPGEYRVIVERPGFATWTKIFVIPANTTTKLMLTLTEKPSQLAVRAVPGGAQVTVDGVGFQAPGSVVAGMHRLVISLAGHREERIDVIAHDGVPIELDVELTPLVALRVEPRDATVLLDGKPVAIEAGGVAAPPGEHDLLVRASGYIERRFRLPASRGHDEEVVIRLERVPPAPRPAPVPRGLTARRKVALGVGALGVALATTAVILGAQSHAHRDEAFSLCPEPANLCSRGAAANRAYQLARTRAIEANIGFGMAGAAAITAAVLWLTGGPESSVAVGPRLGADRGVDLAIAF